MRTKYNNKKTVLFGIKFDSKKEAERYLELRQKQKEGKIEDLELQVRYLMTSNGHKICTYIADFVYWDKEGHRQIIEDCKGYRTPIYRLKKKMLKALLGLEITEV